MLDVACEVARAAVRSKDAQKQLARTSLIFILCSVPGQSEMAHTIALQTTLTAFSITK